MNLKYHLFLPLWSRVVFVDWHGVLSRDLFWHSILSETDHPYHDRVSSAAERLFNDNRMLVRSWMRGEISSAQVIDSMAVRLDRRSKDDYLVRRLFADCARMRFRLDLLKAIRSAVSAAYVIVATDNMDCFAEQTTSISGLRDWTDDILVSSRLGVLKMEDVEAFFGCWLKDHALSFQSAILIDDNVATCQAFRDAGGSAIVYKSVEQTTDELVRWIDQTENANTSNMTIDDRS